MKCRSQKWLALPMTMLIWVITMPMNILLFRKLAELRDSLPGILMLCFLSSDTPPHIQFFFRPSWQVQPKGRCFHNAAPFSMHHTLCLISDGPCLVEYCRLYCRGSRIHYLLLVWRLNFFGWLMLHTAQCDNLLIFIPHCRTILDVLFTCLFNKDVIHLWGIQRVILRKINK